MSSSRAQAQSRACHDRKYLLTLIKMGFLIVVFVDWGEGVDGEVNLTPLHISRRSNPILI